MIWSEFEYFWILFEYYLNERLNIFEYFWMILNDTEYYKLSVLEWNWTFLNTLEYFRKNGQSCQKKAET